MLNIECRNEYNFDIDYSTFNIRHYQLTCLKTHYIHYYTFSYRITVQVAAAIL
jgi:hypothetical protein